MESNLGNVRGVQARTGIWAWLGSPSGCQGQEMAGWNWAQKRLRTQRHDLDFGCPVLLGHLVRGGFRIEGAQKIVRHHIRR